MIDQIEQKKLVANYVLKYVREDMHLGVGTGSTVNFFIENLSKLPHRPNIVVSSSNASTLLLKQYGFIVTDINSVGCVDLYIDGADEVNSSLQMIKGGGAALTGEKIIAACSKKFICIADESKYVARLGKFPLPLEVIPMARSYVARKMVQLGGIPNWRQGLVTDYGNYILDVHNLDMLDPCSLEQRLNNIEGIVTNGLFTLRRADELVLAYTDGRVEVMK